MMAQLRSILSVGLMIAALFVFLSGVLGVWRFRGALNRLHAAAVNDTLGLFLALASLMVAEGFSFVSLKMLLVLLLLWFSSPVSTHLIAQLEVHSSPVSNRPWKAVRLPEETVTPKEDA